MRQNDAFTWYMESDPELRSTVVAVAWLDSAPAWEDLVQRLRLLREEAEDDQDGPGAGTADVADGDPEGEAIPEREDRRYDSDRTENYRGRKD